jgi:hypothetical protein
LAAASGYCEDAALGPTGVMASVREGGPEGPGMGEMTAVGEAPLEGCDGIGLATVGLLCASQPAEAVATATSTPAAVRMQDPLKFTGVSISILPPSHKGGLWTTRLT